MELPLHDRDRDGVELREVDDSQDGVDGRSEPAVANCRSVDANIFRRSLFPFLSWSCRICVIKRNKVVGLFWLMAG